MLHQHLTLSVHHGVRVCPVARERGRRRDRCLAGYRLGDVRRYKKLYNIDLWQHGPYPSPVPAPPTFGDTECWPIPLAEINGNPFLKG